MTQFTGVNVNYCWWENNAHCGPNTATIQALANTGASASRVFGTEDLITDVAPQNDYPFTLKLKIKEDEFKKMHSFLKSANTMEQSYTFKTKKEAEDFAASNSDYNYTITEL